MTNPWNDQKMARLFGTYETNYPEEETEDVSRAFFRQWVISRRATLPHFYGIGHWEQTIARQSSAERKRVWSAVLQELIEDGVLWPKPEPEPAEMLEYDEVTV